MGGQSYINGIPINEIPEKERARMFNRMLIRAVHSIGLRFEREEENDPNTYEKKHFESVAIVTNE